MNRTLSRKEVAKKIGVTVANLKEWEATGVAQIIRDEKRRIRYTPESVEALRSVVAPMTPPYEPPATPIAAPPPVPYFGSPPPSPMPQPVEQYASPPTPSTELTLEETEILAAQFGEALRAEAARQRVPVEEILRRWAWSPTDLPPVPPTFAPLLSVWAARTGRTLNEMWDYVQSYVPGLLMSLEPYEVTGIYTPPRPTYPVSPSTPGYGPPAVASPPQYAAPQYQQYTPPPSAQTRQRYPAPPRTAGYHPTQQWGVSGYVPPSPFSMGPPQPNPVADARANLEIQRIELERRRLERMAGDEEEGRQRAEETEAAREVDLEAARTYAAAKAAVEERQAALEAAQRGKQFEAQQKLAEKRAAVEAEEANRRAEEDRRRQYEAEQTERAIVGILSSIPTFVPPEEAEAIRQQVWAAVQGRSATVATTIARDVVERFVAPHRAAAERAAAREKIARQLLVMDSWVFSSLGPDAQAAATEAVRGYLDSGAADGRDSITAIIEARRLRDEVLEPYKKAEAERKRAVFSTIVESAEGKDEA